MSPGMTVSMPCSFCLPAICTSLPFCFTLAPNARSAISPWSRVFTGSSIRVSPAAKRPANSRHVFHLGAGNGHLVIHPLKMATGNAQRGVASVLRGNVRTHHLQRRNDSRHGPPGKRLVAKQLALKFLPRQDSARRSYGRPEFPQSSADLGDCSALPRPWITMAWSCRSHCTPSARMQPRVLAQSAPGGEILQHRVVPSAIPPSMA